MFRARWTARAKREYEYLRQQAERRYEARQKTGKKGSSKQEGLFKQVHKAIERLVTNPKHPGLQAHEYHSISHPFDSRAKVFTAYAQSKTPSAYRAFWCYGPGRGEITIIAITPHP